MKKYKTLIRTLTIVLTLFTVALIANLVVIWYDKVWQSIDTSSKEDIRILTSTPTSITLEVVHSRKRYYISPLNDGSLSVTEQK